jgi:hypothetical protein
VRDTFDVNGKVGKNNTRHVEPLTKYFAPAAVLVGFLAGLPPVCTAQTAGHGGGTMSEEVQKRFVSLAGGRNASVAFISRAEDGTRESLSEENNEIGGRGGTRTPDPLLAKHATLLQPFHRLF